MQRRKYMPIMIIALLFMIAVLVTYEITYCIGKSQLRRISSEPLPRVEQVQTTMQ